MRTIDSTDRELWEQAVGGDHEAFGLIFDRHAKAVYNHLFRRTADWAAAEDLTSAVFLEAWRKRHTLELERDSALPWLFRVAHYVLLNQRRSLRRYQAAVERLPLPDTVPDHAEDVAGRLDDERRMAEVRQALDRLSGPERRVIELCLWDGLDQQAAAAVLGVAVGTVKSRMHRAKRRLAALLGTGPSAAGRKPVGPVVLPIRVHREEAQ